MDSPAILADCLGGKKQAIDRVDVCLFITIPYLESLYVRYSVTPAWTCPPPSRCVVSTSRHKDYHLLALSMQYVRRRHTLLHDIHWR